MRDAAARASFFLCRLLGRWLRAARYSTVWMDDEDGGPCVRKARSRCAPLLILMGGALYRLLGTGVQVVPQRAWEARERRLYRDLYGLSIRVDAGGTLVLPLLSGQTLASLLEDPALEAPLRWRAIERAVVALAAFHRRGFTHADAMAENVLVDLETGVARWFDFETVHSPRRPLTWRRADDVRALLVTCLLRTAPEMRAASLRLILDTYADDSVTRVLLTSFGSVWRRPLTFHLAQAGLSFECFQEITRLLGECQTPRRSTHPGPHTRADHHCT